MRIEYSTEAEAYRANLRAFIEERLPEGWRGTGSLEADERARFMEMWKRVLHSRGLLAVTWPKEFGGSDLSLLERVVLNEELARAGAMVDDVHVAVGITLVGQTLIAMGTEAQKRHFLPRILSGEDLWCQGFSEPGAGSDLAGLSTRATLVGDEWVINGQKIWTSGAHRSNWICLLCRTDPSVPKHQGITFLLVPMDQPGVEVRPVVNMTGCHEFNEVFFTDARAARELVVGRPHEGWRVAAFLLGLERGDNATTLPMLYRDEVDRLFSHARQLGRTGDPRIRLRLSRAYERVETMRYIGLRTLTRLLAGDVPGAEGALFKLMWSAHHVELTELAVEIVGAETMAPSGREPAGVFFDLPGAEYSSRSWVSTFLAARSAPIRGGSSEILKSVVGERLLGLPREPRVDRGPWRTVPR